MSIRACKCFSNSDRVRLQPHYLGFEYCPFDESTRCGRRLHVMDSRLHDFMHIGKRLRLGVTIIRFILTG
jgi:hypothetical protein